MVIVILLILVKGVALMTILLYMIGINLCK